MTSGLAISSFMPSIISSGIFSTRRADSGLDAMSTSNPFVGVLNMDIASGQLMNAAKGVSELTKDSNNIIAKGFASAEESIKSLSKSDKFFKGVGKVINFTADNINPIICATSAVKVLTSDKDKTGYSKEQAAINEGCALGTMFGFEHMAKNYLGMPKIKNVNGKRVVEARPALYKNNDFLNKKVISFKNLCDKTKVFNKSLHFLPGTLKGLGFVTASISGYKLGNEIGNGISSLCEN